METKIFEKNAIVIIHQFLDYADGKDIETIRIKDLLEACQISRGAFYKYFRNKDDLLNQCILLFFTQLKEQVVTFRSLISSATLKVLAQNINMNRYFYSQLQGICKTPLALETSLFQEYKDGILSYEDYSMMDTLLPLFASEHDCDSEAIRKAVKERKIKMNQFLLRYLEVK